MSGEETATAAAGMGAGTDATSAEKAAAAVVVVFGSTGAVGHKVVEALARCSSVSRVIAVTRRKENAEAKPSESQSAEAEEAAKTFPGIADEQGCLTKVHVQPVDYEELCAADSVEWLAGATVGLCTLGTTHSAAGGRAGFRRVDLDYVVASARLCKAAGVQSFSLLTSQGTTPRVPRWLSSYIWTKAKSEDQVKGMGFAKLAIWRPGLIDRQERRRAVEKFAMKIGMRGISTADLASAMVLDALKLDSGSEHEAVRVFEGNSRIIKLSKGTE